MLTQNCETYCDPRLNYSQAIEAVFAVAGALSAKKSQGALGDLPLAGVRKQRC
jgi:hypothetical protein